jgi:PTS system glucitol/sorbitol-specific IIC component
MDIMGLLSHGAEHFIGVFQAGGQTFVGFVTGILPTLIVLLTAVYAVIELVGEQRIHGLARLAAGNFITNPMAYTFGVFLDEKHKPAFYDSAVSFSHPITGLFPHANSGELFVYLGVAHGIQQLKLPLGPLAVRYFLAGLVVILIRGIVTERITYFLARRQNVNLG